jgi:hypothetical protein
MNIGVENGWGTLIVEMGILGLVLWLLVDYGVALLRVESRSAVARNGVLPGWAFHFLVHVPSLWCRLATAAWLVYQNFVMNAYFWLLTGVLFRLPLSGANAANGALHNRPYRDSAEDSGLSPREGN